MPRHRHQKVQQVTHVEHQGVQDVTSVYGIVHPLLSTGASIPAMSSFPASVVGELPLSLSLPPSVPILQAATTTPISLDSSSTTFTAQLTTSRYPRPPAPGFLYPQPIVPPHVHAHAMQQARETPKQSLRNDSLAHRRHHQIPTSLMATLVFLLIAVAGTWALVVMLVHWRGATTDMQPANRDQEKDESEKRTGWFGRIRRRLNPWARTRTYEVLRNVEGDGPQFNENARPPALSSAHDLRAGHASPVNPFLVAPDQPLNLRVKPRSSAEWAQEHRAYFSFGSGSPIPSKMPNSSHALSCTDFGDVEMEAREAHGRRASLALCVGERALGRQERASWVELGLAAVDGAVDTLAGKIVRFTDDGGKDEALLLPLAKGKQD